MQQGIESRSYSGLNLLIKVLHLQLIACVYMNIILLLPLTDATFL